MKAPTVRAPAAVDTRLKTLSMIAAVVVVVVVV